MLVRKRVVALAVLLAVVPAQAGCTSAVRKQLTGTSGKTQADDHEEDFKERILHIAGNCAWGQYGVKKPQVISFELPPSSGYYIRGNKIVSVGAETGAHTVATAGDQIHGAGTYIPKAKGCSHTKHASSSFVVRLGTLHKG